MVLQDYEKTIECSKDRKSDMIKTHKEVSLLSPFAFQKRIYNIIIQVNTEQNKRIKKVTNISEK